jgi:vacuolar-type H+-ATPase subunit E/Vma4
MSSSEKLLSEEILQDAHKKAERALKKADRRAQQVIADAEKDAEHALEQAREAAHRRAERIAHSIMATLEQEVRRNLLDEQEAELSRLFDTALEQLTDRSGYDLADVLATLAAEAVAAMDADAVVLSLAAEDRPVATDDWLAGVRQRAGRDVALSVDEAPANIGGGVVARSADGKQLYDNSFAARLRRLRPTLRQQIAAEAYPAEPSRNDGTTDGHR